MRIKKNSLFDYLNSNDPNKGMVDDKEPSLLLPTQQDIDKKMFGSTLIDKDFTKYQDYLSQEGSPVYDSPETWDDKRAQRQSNTGKVLKTLGQGVGTFGTALASSAATIGGAAVGIVAEGIDAVYEPGTSNVSGMDIMLNNPVSKGIDAFDKYIKEDLLPVYYTKEQQNSILSAATLTEGVNGLGFLLSAVVGGQAITKALGGLAKIGMMARLGTLESAAAKAVSQGILKGEEAAKAVGLGKVINKLPAVTGAVMGRTGESAMEANGAYNDIKATLTAKRDEAANQLKTTGVTDDYETANLTDEDIDKRAKQQRDNVFFGNMALGLSDLKQYTRWFAPNAYSSIIKKAVTGELGAAKYMVKKESKKQMIGGILKEAAQEAGEEGFQYMLQEGAKKAALSDKNNFASSVIGASDGLFSTIEGQKSMLLGGLLGAGAGTVFKKLNAKKVNADLNQMVDTLNANPSFTSDKYITNAEGKNILNPDYVNNSNTFLNLDKIRKKAIDSGDMHTAELAEKQQFANLVNSRVSANKFDDLIDELEVMGKADESETEQYFESAPKDKEGNKIPLQTIAHQKIQEAKQLKKTIEGLRTIPKFQNLSQEAFNELTNTILQQDSVAKQIKSVISEMNEIHPEINWGAEENLKGDAMQTLTDKLVGPNKAKLEDLEETKNVLVNYYDRLNKTVEQYTKEPQTLEEIVAKVKERKEKEFEDVIQEELDTHNAADEVINKAKESKDTFNITMPDGTVKTVGVNLNGDFMDTDGGMVPEEVVKKGVLEEIKLRNQVDGLDKETPEGEISDEIVDLSVIKPNILSSSVQGHNFARITDPITGEVFENRGAKHEDTNEKGQKVYSLNGQFRKFVDYLAKAANTPFVKKGNNPAPTYEFVTKITTITNEELNKINAGRAQDSKRLGIQFPSITAEDLLNNPAFMPIEIQLLENGKSVSGAITKMHSPDYFFKTQEYVILRERLNNKEIDQLKFDSELKGYLEKYSKYRIDLINKIKTAEKIGEKVRLFVDSKSGGILNINPKVNGKKQVNSITDTFKHINEYSTGLFTNAGLEIKPKGVGVITSIDEHGTGTITFPDNTTSTMKISPNEVGSMVFQSINAAGELVNTRSISKNELSDDQLEAITNLLYHRLSTGEKKIMVKGKEFTIAGNLESGRGIVDSLILLADRNKAEKQLFFKKNGSLVVGKKEYTFKDDEKEIKAAIMDTLRKGNSEANFKTNVAGDSEFVLPTINEEGEFEGEITTYNDYLFKGDSPLIGTFVNKDVPFINSYYGFEMGADGYKTNSIKEVPETPIYPPVNIPSIVITPTEPVLPKTEYTGWKVIKDVINDSYSVENPEFPNKGSMFIDTIEEANQIAADLNAEETNKVVKPVTPVAPVVNADNIKGKQNINGVKEIRFNNPNFKLEDFEIDGNYWSVITSSDRAKVLVNINGTIVPFYLTTNQAGKNLIPGWYPFFGIGKDGWLNKTDKSDMETYYERYWGKEAADIVKSAAEELNAFYGTDSAAFKNDGDPNEKVRPLTTLADKTEDYINSKLSYTPAINDGNARIVLRSNAEQLGKEIIAKYNPELSAKTEPVSDIEAKKADIEKRRENELGRTSIADGNGFSYPESSKAKEINARYDAELADLESPFISNSKNEILNKKEIALNNVKPVYHHTSVLPKNFNFGSFQRGKEQISQFGDGLNASSNTSEFLSKRYGAPIEGEVNDADFVEIDANKSEKDIYKYLVSKGYKFSNPATGTYIGGSPVAEYSDTDPANKQPAIISLFNDFQKSNPEVKGVKINNHIIGKEKVAPFYVIYDSKSFYGKDALSKKIEFEANNELTNLKEKETSAQSPEVTELKEKMEEKAEESIKDCNKGGADLSGKASKYKKK